MTVFAIIFLVALIGAILFFFWLFFWSSVSLTAQVWYTKLCDKKDYFAYDSALQHIANVGPIPVIYLCDLTRMKVYTREKYDKWIKDNPFYFIAFPENDGLTLYTGESNIILSGFYTLMINNLMEKSGHTAESVTKLIEDGKVREKNFNEEQRAKIRELQKKIKEEEERLGLTGKYDE